MRKKPSMAMTLKVLNAVHAGDTSNIMEDSLEVRHEMGLIIKEGDVYVLTPAGQELLGV